MTQDEFDKIEKVMIDNILHYKHNFCKCGCGENIEVKSSHKETGIPKYNYRPPYNKNDES